MTELRTGGSDNYTVQHVLTQLDDHVAMINDLNTNGTNHYNLPTPQTQEAANNQMQNYIDAIKAYLAWDGKDDFGDPLANGIYLYRVIATINEQNIEHRDSAGDHAFVKGFGKMYLIR